MCEEKHQSTHDNHAMALFNFTLKSLLKEKTIVYSKTIPAIRLGNIKSEEESGIKKFVVAEPLEQYRSRIHLP